MLNFFDIDSKLQNHWIVLDRSRKVVDYGADFDALYRKHGGAGRTFYFAAI